VVSVAYHGYHSAGSPPQHSAQRAKAVVVGLRLVQGEDPGAPRVGSGRDSLHGFKSLMLFLVVSEERLIYLLS